MVIVRLCGAALAVALVVSLPRAVARACSIDPCQPSVTLPVSGASMPANVPGFMWRKPPDLEPAADPDYQLQLHVVDAAGVSVEVELEAVERRRLVQIRPLSELTAGTQLVFSYLQPQCGRLARGRVTMSIQVTEPLDLPQYLGALSVKEGAGLIQVASVAGDCDRTILAGYADIALQLSDEALPFSDVLRYELRVDGERPWRFHDVSYASSVERRLGASSLGPAKDRLFAPCTAQPRLSELPELERGAHRVRMVGILPDDTELESDEVDVELHCNGSPSPSASPAGRDHELPLAAADGAGCALVGTVGVGGGAGGIVGAFFVLTLAVVRRRRSRLRTFTVESRFSRAKRDRD